MKVLKLISLSPTGFLATSLFGLMLAGNVVAGGTGICVTPDGRNVPCSSPPSPSSSPASPSHSPVPTYTPRTPTPQELEQRRRQEASNYNVLGNEELKRGYYDKAIQHYLKALQFTPNDQVIRNNLRMAKQRKQRFSDMMSANAKALAYYNQGNWQFAIEYFQRALMHTQDSANRAIIEKNLNNARLALSFETRQQQEDEQVRTWQGQIGSSKTAMDNVFKDITADAPANLKYMEPDSLLSDKPGSSPQTALERQAAALWKLNDLTGAEKIYRRLIAQFKDDSVNKAIAMLRLARILHEKGDDAAASKILNEATAIASGDPQVNALVKLLYAESLYESGDHQAAIEALKEYTRLQPDNTAAIRQLAVLEGSDTTPGRDATGLSVPEVARGDETLPTGVKKGFELVKDFQLKGMRQPALPPAIVQHKNYTEISKKPEFKEKAKRRSELTRQRKTIRAKRRAIDIQLEKQTGDEEDLQQAVEQYREQESELNNEIKQTESDMTEMLDISVQFDEQTESKPQEDDSGDTP